MKLFSTLVLHVQKVFIIPPLPVHQETIYKNFKKQLNQRQPLPWEIYQKLWNIEIRIFLKVHRFQIIQRRKCFVTNKTTTVEYKIILFSILMIFDFQNGRIEVDGKIFCLRIGWFSPAMSTMSHRRLCMYRIRTHNQSLFRNGLIYIFSRNKFNFNQS